MQTKWNEISRNLEVEGKSNFQNVHLRLRNSNTCVPATGQMRHALSDS